MKKIFLALMMFLPAFLYTALAHADASYYVQSDNANLRAEPSFGGKIISKVAKGQTLTLLSKSGNWLKVKVDNKEGYISSLQVSNHPPLAKPAISKVEEQEVKPSARRRASSFTSAAAARGLTDEDKNRDGTEEQSDYKALDKMEAIKVTPEEVKKFKETGK